jgi:hypothetical protein
MLKALKKQLSEEEEAFSLIKKKYPHLRNMSEGDILIYCNCHARSDIVKYVKQLKTEACIEKDMDEIFCSCSDASGNTKYLYIHKKDAEEARIASQREQNITLKIYACPTSMGWHLSKE